MLSRILKLFYIKRFTAQVFIIKLIYSCNFCYFRTNYRLRVCPIQEKTSRDKENHSIIPHESAQKGEWSEVVSISTLDIPTIDQKTCGQHATFIVKDSENIVIFNKSGIIAGTNPFIFGVCIFEVKLELQAAHHSADDVSCIKIGKIIYFFIMHFFLY